MAASSPGDVSTRSIPTVAHGTGAFDDALASLQPDSDPGARILFHGGTREQRQQALATLTRYVTSTVHQFRMPSMLGERRMQTQNALRKAFDHAAEEDAMLFFDSVDTLFTHDHADVLDGEGEEEPTVLEYFFDRVEAYRGIVVLGFKKRAHVDTARGYDVDLVVRFE